MGLLACLALLTACAVSVLMAKGIVVAQGGPVIKGSATPDERLHQLLTVRYGEIPLSDKLGRKVIRVLNAGGQGVRNAEIVIQFQSSKEKLAFRTDREGVAQIKAHKGYLMDVKPGGGVEVRLFNWVIQFPVEVVVGVDGAGEKGKVRKPTAAAASLHRLITVSCGKTPLADKKARKVVRVVDKRGGGVKGVRVDVFHESQLSSFWTSADGVAVIKANQAAILHVYAWGAHVTLTSAGVTRFPIQIVEWLDRGRLP